MVKTKICLDCDKIISFGASRCSHCASMGKLNNHYKNDAHNVCKDCGKTVWRRSIRCKKCSNTGENNPNHRKIKVAKILICTFCGLSYLRRQYYIPKNGNFFCTMSCFQQFQTKWGARRNCEETILRKIIMNSGLRPNKAEISFLNLLSPEWKYLGEGSLIIGGKNPDFWNNKNNLIEFFGCYWHGCLQCSFPNSYTKSNNAQDRIFYFKQFGYTTMVVWEHELKDLEILKSKITQFTEQS